MKEAHPLRKLRRRNNLTQNEMADVLGVNQATLSKYENSLSDIRISVLKNLSKSKKVNVDVKKLFLELINL